MIWYEQKIKNKTYKDKYLNSVIYNFYGGIPIFIIIAAILPAEYILFKSLIWKS